MTGMAVSGALGVTLRDVYRARASIAGVARETPLVESPELSSRVGATVHLKLEVVQETGSFKIRGAANAVLGMDREVRARGVLAVSTGNHGRAVARVAGLAGVPATICLSRLVHASKVEAIRRLGAEVVVSGESQDEAFDAAADLVRTRGLALIDPFDDPLVIAGQGTIGLELLEAVPDLDTVLVPLSGGGLISGIGLTVKAADPRIRVVGVSMARGAAMSESLRAGRPVRVTEEPTLADSLGGGIGLENRYTFRMVRALVDEVVLLDEEEIAAGMAWLFEAHRLGVEGGGAVAVAALLAGKVSTLGTRVVAIVSGGNIDPERLLEVIRTRRGRA